MPVAEDIIFLPESTGTSEIARLEHGWDRPQESRRNINLGAVRVSCRTICSNDKSLVSKVASTFARMDFNG